MAFQHLNGKERRAAAKYIVQENRKFSDKFVQVPFEKKHEGKATRVDVWRNRKFLVQIFDEGGVMRLSVNRTTIDAKGNFNDGISWDELQEIKNAVGFEQFDAVEIYPSEKDVVNVANMRHLWILPEKLSFGWRSK